MGQYHGILDTRFRNQLILAAQVDRLKSSEKYTINHRRKHKHNKNAYIRVDRGSDNMERAFAYNLGR